MRIENIPNGYNICFMNARLKDCRELFPIKPGEKELSQERLGELIGLSQKIITGIESGRTSNPDDDYLIRLAKFFGTTPAWLRYEAEEPPSYLKAKYKHKKSTRIPLIKWDQIHSVCTDLNLLSHITETLPVGFLLEKDVFATEIPESLIPPITFGHFRPRDRLIVRPMKNPTHTCLVIIFEGEYFEPEYVEYTYKNEKRYFRYPGQFRYELMPENMIICGVILAKINVFINF